MMFVKNFYDQLQSFLIGRTVSLTDVTGAKRACNAFLNKAESSYGYGIRAAMKAGKIAKPVNGTYNYGVYFGSDASKCNLSDTTLKTPIESGVSVTSPSEVYVNQQDAYYELSATYALNNVSGDSITVSEVGVFGSYKDFLYMLERTVLPDPITIKPGGTTSITYTIRLTYPTQ